MIIMCWIGPAVARRCQSGCAIGFKHIAMKKREDILSSLEEKAKNLGFIACGFSKPSRPLYFDEFHAWLSNGKNADMSWLERNVQTREDPTILLKGCKTIVSLAYPYPSQKGRIMWRIAGYDGTRLPRKPFKDLRGLGSYFREELRIFFRHRLYWEKQHAHHTWPRILLLSGRDTDHCSPGIFVH
jgi:hypothetical protein